MFGQWTKIVLIIMTFKFDISNITSKTGTIFDKNLKKLRIFYDKNQDTLKRRLGLQFGRMRS